MSKTNINVKLTGKDGNVFNLIGICTQALREHGLKNKIAEFQSEDTSSKSYEEALGVMINWFNVE